MMEICTAGVIVAVLIGFLVGLLLDVDTFAGGIFSILKGPKNKDKDK
jgi:hypothetical protein